MKKLFRMTVCVLLSLTLILPMFGVYADDEPDDKIKILIEFDRARYRPGDTAVLTVSAVDLDDERTAGAGIIDLQTYISFSNNMIEECVPMFNPALSAKIANESEKAFMQTTLHPEVLIMYFYHYEGVSLRELADDEGRLVLGTVELKLKNQTGRIYAEFVTSETEGNYAFESLAERSQVGTDMPKTMICSTGERVEAAVEYERTSSGGGGGGGRRPDWQPPVEIGDVETPKVETPFGLVDKFEDIDDYSWAQDAIYELRAKGIINGVSKTEYAPGVSVKRGDFVLMLSRMLELDGADDDNFPDVPKDSYYYTAIGRAKAAGIALGYGEDFMPERTVSRQELITLAYRAFHRYGYVKEAANLSALDNYSDKDDIHEYAKKPIASMIRNGTIQGAYGYITPLNNATRAEVAVLCARLMKLIEQAEE